MSKLSIAAIILLVVGIIGTVVFYFACINHVEVNEIGIAYNAVSGDVTVQEKPGFHITSPFVRVITISTLPRRVTIPTDAKIIPTRLVRFNPAGALKFIEMQGFSYTLDNRLDNILLGYAFSGGQYPFLDIIEESTNGKPTTK